MSLVLPLAVVLALTWLASQPGRRPSIGAAVRGEVRVTDSDPRLSRAQNSPTLVAHPMDPTFLALAHRWDAPVFNCALHVSSDAGAHWRQVNPLPKLPAGADRCYGPEIGFDRDGTLYFLFSGLQGRGNVPMGTFLTSSQDGGRNFGPPRRLLGPNAFGVRMAVDHSSGPPPPLPPVTVPEEVPC